MLKAKSTNTATVNYLQYDHIFTLDNLYYAYKTAKKNKLNTARVFKFSIELSKNLHLLLDELITRKYSTRPCFNFQIFCKSGQKMRSISSPSFRDSVVQHALYNNIYHEFDKTFIYDSYGCRKCKGAHKASDRCQEFIKKSDPNSYYLQLDIRKYYYSIDHKILKESISRVIKDNELVELLMKFVNTESEVGLNVGSMLSQLFGLIYLNRLDHYIKRVLKVKYYIRYVDDMVIIGESKERCIYLKSRIEEYIHKYLKLEFSKWQIKPINHGINFVGYRTWRNKRLVRKRSLRSFSRALKSNNERSIQSLLGHAKRTDTYEYFLSRLKHNKYNIKLPIKNNKISS